MNHRDEAGETPLMLATRTSRQAVVQLLLLHGILREFSVPEKIPRVPCIAGADLSITNGRASTVLKIAKIKDYSAEMVKLLEAAKDVTWSPDQHQHFLPSFHLCVLSLLILHRTSAFSSAQLTPSHVDASNRFWNLPKPLLFRILGFSAPPARVILSSKQ